MFSRIRRAFAGTEEPRRALRVRVQHESLDNAAVEGLWVGDYNGYLHLRAVKVRFEGEQQPFRHDEVLLPAGKVLYMEVLGADANPDPSTVQIGD